jgi:hypothetical protein
MTVYSYAQLESLWIDAGGPKALAPVAAAIGEAESGGNSDALNPNDNGGTQSSFGIWQISNGTHTPPSPSWANPAVNAQLAVGKWKGAGQSFSPWGTYDSGAYRAFLSNSTSPDPNVPGSATALAAQTGAASASDCLVPNPLGISLGPLSLSAGPACLLSKSNARAFIGAGLLLAGGAVAVAGLAVLAAAAGVKAAGPVGTIAEGVGAGLLLVPGAEGAGAAVIAGGRQAKQVGQGRAAEVASKRQRRAQREDTATRRRLGEPRQNEALEVRGGAVRQNASQRAAQRSRERRAAGGDEPPF